MFIDCNCVMCVMSAMCVMCVLCVMSVMCVISITTVMCFIYFLCVPVYCGDQGVLPKVTPVSGGGMELGFTVVLADTPNRTPNETVRVSPLTVHWSPLTVLGALNKSSRQPFLTQREII